MRLKNLFVIPMFTAIAITGCKSKSTQELIVNKWQVTEVKGGHSDEMSAEQKEAMKKDIIEFTKDGKFHIIDAQNPYEGTYTISSDGKKLSVTPLAGGAPEENLIKEISATKLTIADTSGFQIICEAKK